MIATEVSKIRELAVIVGEKEGTLSAWNGRKRIPPKKIFTISRIVGCRPEWLEFGVKPMRSDILTQEQQDHYGKQISPYIEKVTQLMGDMDEDMQKDICLSVEKEKLLRDLLRQKDSDEKAG